MKSRYPTLRFAYATAVAITAGLASSADAQLQIIPGQPGPEVGQGLPAGAPDASNGLPIGVPEATGGVYGEQQLRFDSQHPWMHGYWQEMPAYGGFGAYRPYNYKHVLSQSQAAGGWGMSPTMPYSQQFWHRYRQRAAMRPQVNETLRQSSPATQPTGVPTAYGRRVRNPPSNTGPQLRFPRR